MQKVWSIVVMAVAAMACAQGAFAQTKTWTGATSNVWNVATNWSPSGVPTATDDVLIGPGAAPVSLSNDDATVRSLDVRRELRLVNWDLNVNGGGISMQGGLIVLDSFADITLIGGTQSISANASGGTVRSVGVGPVSSISARNCALTIGPTVTIESASDEAIVINPSDGFGRFGSVTVQGTVIAKQGRITVIGPLTNYDPATKALNGGRWIVESGRIDIQDNVLSNIDIDVIGTNTFVSYGDLFNGSSFIEPLQSINVNLGTIEVRNRDSVQFFPPGGTFQNAGTIRLAEGTRFEIPGGNFRTLPGSTIEMTITGGDQELQQPRIIISGAAQFNNTSTLRVPISNVVPFDCGSSFTLFQHASRVGTIGTIQTVPSSTTVNAVYSNVPNTQIQVTGNCQGQSICDDIDFNNNSVFPEEQDIIDFFNVLAGGTCL